MKQKLVERLMPEVANMCTESKENAEGRKTMYMDGIFIQGSIRNQNGRVYPAQEIMKAVDDINERIKKDGPVVGEADHPENLSLNMDRVSHMILGMRMEGNDGLGKLEIIDELQHGRTARVLIEKGVKLGVSSRGSGDVNESTGQVKDFGIITVDLVLNPSAPKAFPKPVLENVQQGVSLLEALLNHEGGQRILEMAADSCNDLQSDKAYASLSGSRQMARFIDSITA